MFKENNLKSTLLAIISIIIIIFSILNKNYLVSILYIISILISAYITKDKSIYSVLYSILLVSIFFDYSLYIPYIDNVYIFHVILLIFTALSLYKVFKNQSIFLKLDKRILIF